MCVTSSRVDLILEYSKCIPELESRGKTCTAHIITLVQKAIELVKDLSVLGSKIFLPLGKNVTEHQQLYGLCLVNN